MKDKSIAAWEATIKWNVGIEILQENNEDEDAKFL